MPQQQKPSVEAAARDSTVMLAAMGVLAYAASMMTHEGLGHGGYCFAVGSRTTMMTGWMETCAFPGVAPLGIKAAGPGMQLCAGLLAWRLLPRSALKTARLHYFLWLYMVFNLFIASSYIAFSGITGIGDAAGVIAGRQPRFLWRSGLVLLGSVAYFLFMQLTARELKRLAGFDDNRRRLYRLVWIPYASAGVFAFCAGILNQTMEHGLAIEMASLSSFGSGAGLFYLPEAQRRMELATPSQTSYVRWNVAWGIAAAFVFTIFLFLIGPGLKL